MLGDKDNHNIHGSCNMLAGLGSTKLRRLIIAGIHSMHALMGALDNDRTVVNAGLQHLLAGWQDEVDGYYDHLRNDLVRQQKRLADGDPTQNEVPRQQGAANNPYRRSRPEHWTRRHPC
jgi:hypothetical protein